MLDMLAEIIHNTKIDFIFLFNMATVKSLQSCETLCNTMDCSPPGSSVHGILQARMLEWVAMPSPRGPSRPGDRTQVSYVSRTGSLPLVPPVLGHLKVAPETCYISVGRHCPREWEACLFPLLSHLVGTVSVFVSKLFSSFTQPSWGSFGTGEPVSCDTGCVRMSWGRGSG